MEPFCFAIRAFCSDTAALCSTDAVFCSVIAEFSSIDRAFCRNDALNLLEHRAFCSINRAFCSNIRALMLEYSSIKAQNLARDFARTRAARKGAFGEKAFVVALHTFPADHFFLVGRRDVNVVMFGFRVALGASNERLFGHLRVDLGHHQSFLLNKRIFSL